MYYYCAVCGQKVNRNKAYARKHVNGQDHYLCCPLCQKTFEQDPQKYIDHTEKH